MKYQNVFQRYEMKYLLTRMQKEAILQGMKDYMALDKYGRTIIRNLYFDTEDYRLIRHSIERPAYKEKLRLRSYEKVSAKGKVFVELKKKYKSVVYKRRLALPEAAAVAWLGGGESPESCQIAREIDYFMDYYGTLKPRVFLSYEREAYYCKEGGDFRVTFDENILCRREELSLESEVWGTPILDENLTLMEIKTAGGIPLWMTRLLTEQKIYKTSFSKYGTAYQKLIFKDVFLYV